MNESQGLREKFDWKNICNRIQRHQKQDYSSILGLKENQDLLLNQLNLFIHLDKNGNKVLYHKPNISSHLCNYSYTNNYILSKNNTSSTSYNKYENNQQNNITYNPGPAYNLNFKNMNKYPSHGQANTILTNTMQDQNILVENVSE